MTRREGDKDQAEKSRTEGAVTARMCMASCGDVSSIYPPDAILDRNLKTFWMTTGMYPHEFVVSFEGLVCVRKIIIASMRVAKWRVEATTSDSPVGFKAVCEQDLQGTEYTMQTASLVPSQQEQTAGTDQDAKAKSHTEGQIQARYLRFIIASGYAPFASVHRLVVYGEPLDGEGGGV